MDIGTVLQTLASFPGTRIIDANGDAFAIYDPDGTYEEQPRQGWATVVTSDLDRPGAYRLNIGLTRNRFRELVDPSATHDTTALDVLLPHPVYSGYHWVCVVNPDRTWPAVQQLLVEAHAFAARKHDNTARRRARS